MIPNSNSKQKISNELDTYENKQSNIRNLKTPNIEVFHNIYYDKTFSILLEIPEFTAICPKTGIPDFGIIYISYKPQKYCIELKSLKEYFSFYRNIGIFHENLVNKALDDIIKAVSPMYTHLKAVYKPRGGITTTVEREYYCK